ncbi:Uncharacterized conserved protein [Actinomyces bovis]|uniref:Uncharacterized conserved protein n=1 Tax=Actinomyces bovis TaxID=1658 RepID=A0ABY1VMV0_9ACTO|nr:DUF2304 domain-containing protein [Actinomyces bovis]SPT53315.1 Uncharacterized conserved protein [Actinomyces bovis]VEG52657.1 Uncharacterized conserved protein [Actinomyces israelii]
MLNQMFFVVIALAMMVFILSFLRSRKLREKYAALWIVVGTAVLILALVPHLLEMLTQLVGIQVPSNLLFLLAILLLLGVSLHLSLAISHLEEETRVLAENVAILNSIVVANKLDATVGTATQDQTASKTVPQEPNTSSEPDHA